jgi:hypothetical protein
LQAVFIVPIIFEQFSRFMAACSDFASCLWLAICLLKVSSRSWRFVVVLLVRTSADHLGLPAWLALSL